MRTVVLLPALAMFAFASGCKKNSDVNTDPGTNPGITDPGPAPLVFPDFEPTYTVVANAADGVARPQDLDFHPDADRSHELWVVNKGTEDTGSDMVILFDVRDDSAGSENRRDGNAWHFMNLTSAIAFSPDTTNWANSPEITDANHSGGIFTGPSLWSGDLDVFAMPSGGNGSHLDMVHQSPNSMGIAWEKKDIYWVFDGYADELVRYDFADDHGPGNDYHADAKVKRYSQVPVARVEGTPSHMVIDQATGWMYIADTAGGSVLRVDTNSGTKGDDIVPALNFEPLAMNVQMEGEVWETFTDGLTEPCGIEVFGEVLYVSDRATGEIIAYEISTAEEIGRVQTDAQAIMGLKADPDGVLHYVDRGSNEVVRIEEG